MTKKELTYLVAEMCSLIRKVDERAVKIKSLKGADDEVFDIIGEIYDGELTSVENTVNSIIKALISNEAPAQFRGQVIDIFEDFCDRENISIQNESKAVYDREAGYEPGENAAIIFGEDYDSIADTAVNFLTHDSVAAMVVKNFATILKDRGTRSITKEEESFLEKEVDSLIATWCDEYTLEASETAA